MTPVEYILDPQYQCTGLAVKKNKEKPFWVEGDEVQEFFDSQPEDVMAVSHNALFDMPICAWRYGWVPRVMVDTLGVSRAILQAKLKSLSLNSVAKHLGLGAKTDALANVKNMRLEQIRQYPDLYLRFIEYGLNDAELCYGIFEKFVLSGQFPAMEIAVMDAVLRCAVTPQFKVNPNVLQQSLNTIKQEKENTLAQAMLLGASGKGALMSNDQFADLLRQFNVDPPMKISGTTGKQTYAFAKSDQDFIDLLEHPDIAVQTIVGARLGHKSTIEETRHERFIKIAGLEWPKTKRSPGGQLQLMPMPLRYSGAHTHRLSGDWKMNVQNMGRGSMLRQSLEAPEGYVVVAGDESQVEARFVCTLCGQEDMRSQFERDEDVYRLFAAALFGKDPAAIAKIERFIGKQCILGLGFGLGDEKFTRSIPILAWNQLGIKLPYTPEEGKAAVNLYRTKNFHVANTWKLLNTMGIQALATGQEWRWGPVVFRKEEILLPNGMKLYYHNLRQVAGGRFGTEWIFEYGGKIKRCYGGMLLENIVQALARIITMEAAVRVRMRLAKLKIPLALQVHDELVFVVKKEYEAVTRMVLEHELKVRPAWLPNIPLNCEVGSGPNYGDAK
jgi:DNA polymerase